MKSLSSLIVAGTAATLLPLAAAFAQSPPAPAEPAQGQGQGTTFESLDADGDGKISKTEAMANATVSAQFSSYDLNKDGFIERSEVNQANNSPSETPKQ